jgi:hypothetical protein
MTVQGFFPFPCRSSILRVTTIAADWPPEVFFFGSTRGLVRFQGRLRVWPPTPLHQCVGASRFRKEIAV